MEMNNKSDNLELYLQEGNYDVETLKAINDMGNDQFASLVKPDQQLMSQFAKEMSRLDASKDIDDESKEKEKLILTVKTVTHLSGMYTKALDVVDGSLVLNIVKLVLVGAFSSLIQYGEGEYVTLVQDLCVESAFHWLCTPSKFKCIFIAEHDLGADVTKWAPDVKEKYDLELESHIKMCEHIYRTDSILVQDGGIYQSTGDNLDDAGHRYNARQSKKSAYRFNKAKRIITATMGTPIVQKAKEFAEKYQVAEDDTLTQDDVSQFFSAAIRNIDGDDADGDVNVVDVVGSRAFRLSWEFITEKVAEAATRNLVR